MKKTGVFLLLISIFSCNTEKDITDTFSTVDKGARKGYNPKWIPNAVDESIGSEPEQKEGVLHFKDADSFLKEAERLKNMSVTDRINYTKSINFKSLLSIYNEIEISINQAVKEKNKKSFDNLLEYYKLFVKIDVDSSLKYNISDEVKASFLNEEGLVYIGKMLYFYTDNQQQIIFDGDKKKINTVSDAVEVIDYRKIIRGARVGAGPIDCPAGMAITLYAPGVPAIYRDKLDVQLFVNVVSMPNGLYSSGAFGKAFGRPQVKNGFPFFYWQNASSTHSLYSRWTLIGQPPFPEALNVQEEDYLFSETSAVIEHLSQSIGFSDRPSSSDIYYYFSFPGTGYYKGGYTPSGIPMSCP
ncbi:MAG: hypothetical protein JWP57_4275 [Spirosoma sp.]|nr:hypothetical protein [Spirosoma sp.]